MDEHIEKRRASELADLLAEAQQLLDDERRFSAQLARKLGRVIAICDPAIVDRDTFDSMRRREILAERDQFGVAT